MLILLCFQFSIFSFLPTPKCFSFLQPSGDSWKSESRIGRSSQRVCNALIAGQRRSFRATFSLLNIAYLSFPRYTCTVSSKTKLFVISHTRSFHCGSCLNAALVGIIFQGHYVPSVWWVFYKTNRMSQSRLLQYTKSRSFLTYTSRWIWSLRLNCRQHVDNLMIFPHDKTSEITQ